MVIFSLQDLEMLATLEQHDVATHRPRSVSRPCAIVVDDDRDCQTAMQLMLTDLGYDVWVADNGIEALERYQEVGHADLVIVDLKLPILSGPTLISNLNLVDPELPIIATTGGSFTTARLRTARIRGAVTVLPKPFGRSEFVAAVRRAER
jgi:CheY-like chemotaxis protein